MSKAIAKITATALAVLVVVIAIKIGVEAALAPLADIFTGTGL